MGITHLHCGFTCIHMTIKLEWLLHDLAVQPECSGTEDRVEESEITALPILLVLFPL